MKKIFIWIFISLLSISWTYAWEAKDYLIDTYKSKWEQYVTLIDTYTLKHRNNTSKLAKLSKDIKLVKEVYNLETNENPKYIQLNTVLNYLLERLDSLNRVVKAGDTISVHYSWAFENWEIFDSSHEIGTPLIFKTGGWIMIAGFDNWVLWMKIWETKTIKISPEQWYGEYDDTKTMIVDKSTLSSFGDAGYELIKWTSIPTQFGNIKIIGATDTEVTLDLNHELAWKTLFFEVELLNID